MDEFYEKINNKYRKIKGIPFIKFKCEECGKFHYEDCYGIEYFMNADYCKKCNDVIDKQTMKDIKNRRNAFKGMMNKNLIKSKKLKKKSKEIEDLKYIPKQ